MSNRYIVIMAGGAGTRFWPASRQKHPKQFLTIGGNVSLLRQTALRVLEAFPWDNIVVVTAKAHAELAKGELPEIPEENLLIEPEGRNTAPCIAWATEILHARNPEAVVAVLPADHFIGQPERFLQHLDAAMNAADTNIVLLGLVPNRPETGYGYIQKGDALEELGDHELFKVSAFKEKPDFETAKSYLSAGDYLWNSGMFVFRTEAMRKVLQTHLPELFEAIGEIVEDPKKLKRLYSKLESVSIDYGLMEKLTEISVIPSEFAWSDVGSWHSAYEIQDKDAQDNVVLGDVMHFDDVRGCLIDARAGRLVALAGVSDLVVVDTTDALLILPRDQSQRVRELVDRIRAEEREELL
jgi:mannose-1-phosphate guanylyltransferase